MHSIYREATEKIHQLPGEVDRIYKSKPFIWISSVKWNFGKWLNIRHGLNERHFNKDILLCHAAG